MRRRSAFAERVPNPARDKRAKLPQEARVEVNPPTAAHVLAAHRLLPSRYRLPLLVLDATGMRVSELEALRWGDVDESKGALAGLVGEFEDESGSVGSGARGALRSGSRARSAGGS